MTALTELLFHHFHLSLDSRHRQLVWLSGARARAIDDAQKFLGQCVTAGCEGQTQSLLKAHQILWIGDGSPTFVTSIYDNDAKRQLGSEYKLVVFNAVDSFDCDALAAISGTLTAGGLLILITPPESQWAALDQRQKARVTVYAHDRAHHSRFVQRFCRLLKAHTVDLPVAATDAVSLRWLCLDQPPGFSVAIDEPTGDSKEQFKRIEQLKAENQTRADSKQSYRPSEALQEQSKLADLLVPQIAEAEQACWMLTADRGRGKSALLGILAARLHANYQSRQKTSNIESTDIPAANRARGGFRVAVTAPGKKSTAILQRHFAGNADPNSPATGLDFYAADYLLSTPLQLDLLLIDEAAAIPQSVLQKLIKQYPKTLLATTVQGYEGAGRGFALKFRKFLERSEIPHQQLTLTLPMRWGAQDPLEIFINSSLLLDVELAPAPDCDHFAAASLRMVTKKELLQNEDLLRDVFAILLQAHYQTKPMDLRHLLDGENLRVFIKQSDQKVVAAAIVAFEGPIEDPSLRRAIVEKSRRPRGHLLPQLLSQWTLDEHALDLVIARIVRIAVHPSLHGKGVGSSMLSELCQYLQLPQDQQKQDQPKHSTDANEENLPRVDACGAMFGYEEALFRFWSKNSFQAIHLGFRKNKSSGARSLSVLLPLSQAAKDTHQQALILFYDNPSSLLIDTGNVPPSFQPQLAPLLDLKIIDAYCKGQRSFSDSYSSIIRLCKNLQDPASALMASGTEKTAEDDADNSASDQSAQLVSLCATHPVSLELIATKLELQGKKEAEVLLRKSLNHYLA